MSSSDGIQVIGKIEFEFMRSAIPKKAVMPQAAIITPIKQRKREAKAESKASFNPARPRFRHNHACEFLEALLKDKTEFDIKEFEEDVMREINSAENRTGFDIVPRNADLY